MTDCQGFLQGSSDATRRASLESVQGIAGIGILIGAPRNVDAGRVDGLFEAEASFFVNLETPPIDEHLIFCGTVYAGYRQNRRDITLRRAVKSKSKHLVRDPELCRTKCLNVATLLLLGRSVYQASPDGCRGFSG